MRFLVIFYKTWEILDTETMETIETGTRQDMIALAADLNRMPICEVLSA